MTQHLYIHKPDYILFDTPPNLLKDSNANSKVKTMKEDEVGVRFVTRSTSRVEGVC
jgi:hypothetical protein